MDIGIVVVSTKYPIYHYVSYVKLSSNFKHTILSISSHVEPQNYEEASNTPAG